MNLELTTLACSKGDVALIKVCAEKLDLSNASRFKSQLEPLARQHKYIVLDLESVHFVDSSGFGAILGCLRELSDRGGDIKLCNVQKRVRMILEMVRIHKIIALHNSSEEAVRAFDAAG